MNRLRFQLVMCLLWGVSMLFAQRIDTLGFNEHGHLQIRKIQQPYDQLIRVDYMVYDTIFHTEPMSAEERFMRGMPSPQSERFPAKRIDSTLIYYLEREDLFRDQLPPDSTLLVKRYYHTGQDLASRLQWADMWPYCGGQLFIDQIFANEFVRAGDSVQLAVQLYSAFDEELNLRVESSSLYLTGPSHLRLEPQASHTLKLTVLAGDYSILRGSVTLYGPAGESIPVRLRIERYDLNETDFWQENANGTYPTHTLPMAGRPLRLKMRDEEKVLHVYQHGKLIRSYTIPKIMNEISGLTADDVPYLLEVVDLGSTQRRYCRVHLR